MPKITLKFHREGDKTDICSLALNTEDIQTTSDREVWAEIERITKTTGSIGFIYAEEQNKLALIPPSSTTSFKHKAVDHIIAAAKKPVFATENAEALTKMHTAAPVVVRSHSSRDEETPAAASSRRRRRATRTTAHPVAVAAPAPAPIMATGGGGIVHAEPVDATAAVSPVAVAAPAPAPTIATGGSGMVHDKPVYATAAAVAPVAETGAAAAYATTFVHNGHNEELFRLEIDKSLIDGLTASSSVRRDIHSIVTSGMVTFRYTDINDLNTITLHADGKVISNAKKVWSEFVRNVAEKNPANKVPLDAMDDSIVMAMVASDGGYSIPPAFPTNRVTEVTSTPPVRAVSLRQ